jgi:hypothetical protein
MKDITALFVTKAVKETFKISKGNSATVSWEKPFPKKLTL